MRRHPKITAEIMVRDYGVIFPIRYSEAYKLKGVGDKTVVEWVKCGLVTHPTKRILDMVASGK